MLLKASMAQIINNKVFLVTETIYRLVIENGPKRGSS